MLGASGAALAAAAAARAFSTSAAVQAAAPAVASASQRGFLSKLWGSGSRVDVPLTDALPGVVVPDAVSPSAEAPSTRLTKLKNGMTIATENTPVRCRCWAFRSR